MRGRSPRTQYLLDFPLARVESGALPDSGADPRSAARDRTSPIGQAQTATPGPVAWLDKGPRTDLKAFVPHGSDQIWEDLRHL